MTSTANVIEKIEKKEIVMRRGAEKPDLRQQKFAGLVMVAVIIFMTAVCSEFAAAFVLLPMALAAVFSKEKILDFGIFPKKSGSKS